MARARQLLVRGSDIVAAQGRPIRPAQGHFAGHWRALAVLVVAESLLAQSALDRVRAFAPPCGDE
jgi:hypothetical protein